MISDFLGAYEYGTPAQVAVVGFCVVLALVMFWLWYRLETRPTRKPYPINCRDCGATVPSDQVVAHYVERPFTSSRCEANKLATKWVAQVQSVTASPDCKVSFTDERTLWHRDCLLNAEGSLSDAEFLDRWRGRIPRRPIVLDGGWATLKYEGAPPGVATCKGCISYAPTAYEIIHAIPCALFPGGGLARNWKPPVTTASTVPTTSAPPYKAVWYTVETPDGPLNIPSPPGEHGGFDKKICGLPLGKCHCPVQDGSWVKIK